MGQALHDRVEKACVSSVFHSKTYPLLQVGTGSPHQLIGFLTTLFLKITFEVLFVFKAFLAFELQLSAALRADGRGWLHESIETGSKDTVRKLVRGRPKIEGMASVVKSMAFASFCHY